MSDMTEQPQKRPERYLVPGVFVLVVGSWELGIHWGKVAEYIVPAPSAIVKALINGLKDGTYISNSLTTLGEAMAGFAIAAMLGLALGTLIAQSRTVEKTLYPYLITIQTTPKVAIAPLFIIWFGFGIASKIIIAATVAFFPILVNVIAGLRSTDQQRIDLMRSLNATPWQIFRMVRLPSAAPMIFAGLNIAVIFSILGAIVGEFVGSKHGLGNLIVQKNFNLDTAGVFAALACLSAMGVSLHLIMHWLQRRLLFWADSTQTPNV